MTFDLKQFDEFEVTSLERKALNRLAVSKDFELLEVVMTRWLVWRAHMLASNPRQGEQDVDLVDLQGGYAAFKKLFALVNNYEEPTK